MTLTRNIQALILAVFLSIPSLALAARGDPAELEAVLLSGEKFNIEEHRGKVVVVNFWATWCAICRAEFPGWQRVYNDYKDRDFEMIAVSIDRSKEDLDKFMKKNAYTVPIVWRFDERETDGFPRIRGTPTTYFVDRDGKIAKRSSGRLHESQLRSTVDGLMAN